MNKKLDTSKNKSYELLKSSIAELLQHGRAQSARAINTILVQTYWHIGQYIVEFEQKGDDRSEYGSELVDKLSKDLSLEYGKGFSRTNLKTFRKLYLTFPIGQTLSDQLSWSHYVEILKADNANDHYFVIFDSPL